MELIVGKTYSSNNPCFPGQLFHVTDYKCAKRFGKDNVLITYERWAFPALCTFPYLVETTTSWFLNTRTAILGLQLPGDLQLEFDKLRVASSSRVRNLSEDSG